LGDEYTILIGSIRKKALLQEGVKHPLAIHVAQNQRYTTEDENVCRTGIGYYGWERKFDQLWCHRAHPLVLLR